MNDQNNLPKNRADQKNENLKSFLAGALPAAIAFELATFPQPTNSQNDFIIPIFIPVEIVNNNLSEQLNTLYNNPGDSTENILSILNNPKVK